MVLKLAEVAELADALVSGTSGSNTVGVRIPPSALSFQTHRFNSYKSVKILPRMFCVVHISLTYQ